MGGTGHGLLFGDRCDRVQQVYGSPHSDEHSARGAQESNLFVYHFDRGTKEAQLTLEITCDSASKQVRTIELAASRPANPWADQTGWMIGVTSPLHSLTALSLE